MTFWSVTHAKLHRMLRSSLQKGSTLVQTAQIIHSPSAGGLLPANSAILIGVSGGQDSLCLAKLLLDLQPKWDWQLAIVHCVPHLCLSMLQ